MRFTVGEVLGEAWHLYTRHSGRLIAVGAIVFGFLSAVQALINSTGQRALIPVSVGVTIVGVYWLQGALVVIVDDLRDGKVDLPIREVFRRVEPRLWTLIGTGLIAAATIGSLLVLGFVTPLGLVLVVPAVALVTLWSVVTPAIVLERQGVFAAFRRSQRLVSGDFWRVLAVVLVTVVLAAIVATMIVALLSPLPPFFDLYVAGVIANSITIPFVALAWTLMFFDLRAVKG
jgi:hypothetical protein